ncbi:Nmad4 family putative nucleotide modification protein [Streptococcus fryi]
MRTLEELYAFYGATDSLIPFKDWLLVAYYNGRAFQIDFYKTEDKLPSSQNYLRHYAKVRTSEVSFVDQGHALKWAFDQLTD